MSKPLGWRPGPVDPRDWVLRARIEAKMTEPTAKEYGSRFWYSPSTLKQWTGSCVGHSLTQRHNSSPGVHRLTDDDAMKVYDLAQRKYDPWEDTPPEEGTNVRAGAMAARELGLIKSFAMGYGTQDKTITVPQLARWILNVGPCVIGISWLEGFDNPTKDNDYFIRYEGRERGGHAIECDGVSYSSNPDKSWFRLHNSWGDWGYRAYGHGGFCRVSWRTMEEIMEDPNATVCSPVEA